MDLRDLLRKKQSDMDDNDPAWAQFIKDHRDEIVAKATRRRLTPDAMNVVKYDLRRYLRSIRYNENLYWIVLYINTIDSDADFIKISDILVPNETQISDLRNIFISLR